jgi:bifunctional non-homologous end joining protein LigD
LLVLAGSDVMTETLDKRRHLLDTKVLPRLVEPIRQSPELKGHMTDLVRSVKTQGLKGSSPNGATARTRPANAQARGRRCASIRARNLSLADTRSVARHSMPWCSGTTKEKISARTRNGFTPKLRAELLRKFKPLEISDCPFSNLPEKRSGRWGAGLTAAKMADCRWLKPLLVGQFEFTEWTPENHLRHSRFIGLREDKNPKDVRRE